VNTDNDESREAAAVESLRDRNVDGFIFATATLQHPVAERLAVDGTPVILVNRRTASSDIPSVTPDDAAGVALAMRHLVELGHQRIAHLAGPQTLSTGLNRLRAYRHALHDHGLEPDDELVVVCEAFTEAAGARALSQLLDRGVEFTAVLAGNDLLALGCYDAFAAHGLSCPADVSVVGFNDTPFMDKLHPPLTTVRIPHYEIGAEAARLLLEGLRTPERPARSVLLPLSLIVRESTAPPSAARVGTGVSGHATE
jgi:LacI family transcriptional regulator